jgi:hypothetical protein
MLPFAAAVSKSAWAQKDSAVGRIASEDARPHAAPTYFVSQNWPQFACWRTPLDGDFSRALVPASWLPGMLCVLAAVQVAPRQLVELLRIYESK